MTPPRIVAFAGRSHDVEAVVGQMHNCYDFRQYSLYEPAVTLLHSLDPIVLALPNTDKRRELHASEWFASVGSTEQLCWPPEFRRLLSVVLDNLTTHLADAWSHQAEAAIVGDQDDQPVVLTDLTYLWQYELVRRLRGQTVHLVCHEMQGASPDPGDFLEPGQYDHHLRGYRHSVLADAELLLGHLLEPAGLTHERG